jgi:hypothetical protein
MCVAAFEAKYDSPVGPDGHGPETHKVALEGMKSEARQIHVRNIQSFIEPSENALDLAELVRVNSMAVTLLVQAPKPSVSKVSYHMTL